MTPGRGSAGTSRALEWAFFGGVWLIVGVHGVSVALSSEPAWSRVVTLGVGGTLGVWVVGVLADDRAKGLLLLTLLGVAGIVKPAVSDPLVWQSFSEEWNELGVLLVRIQLISSVVVVTTGYRLYSQARRKQEADQGEGAVKEGTR